MTILVTADLHFSDNPRDNYRHNFVDWLAKKAEELSARAIIVAGDLCEEKDRHSAMLVNIVVQHFDKLSQCCPVIVLEGNHDYVSDPNNPFFAFLSHLDNVHWIGDITTGNQLRDRIGSIRGNVLADAGECIFLPHTRDITRWKNLDFKKYDYVFAHNTFAGANIGPRRLEGIPLDMFTGRAKIISGDIHVPQTFDCVTYCGAPYLCDFGDDYDPRIIVLDKLKMKSVPIPGVQKRLVTITDVKDLPQGFKGAGIGQGDILKVRVNLPPGDREAWATIQQDVKDWCVEHGFVPYTVQPVGPTNQGTKRKSKLNGARTDKQILGDYCKRHGLTAGQIAVGEELL